MKEEIRGSVRRKRKRHRMRTLAGEILRDSARHPERYSDPEVKSAIDYLKSHGLSAFLHPFSEKYDQSTVEVLTDGWSGLNYVMHAGRPLYMKRGGSVEGMRHCYNMLMLEQDPLSPHCYRTETFDVEPGDVLFDVGCADGNFSLDNIEKASKVFLFEVDDKWLEALCKTFESWKDKVVIINKFVSDRDGADTITVDTVVRQYGIDAPVFLKLDVEGAEADVLKGAAETLARPDTRAIVCTYHRDGDHEALSRKMESEGYYVETSPGRILFIYDEGPLKPPYFRRGLIYCTKKA